MRLGERGVGYRRCPWTKSALSTARNVDAGSTNSSQPRSNGATGVTGAIFSRSVQSALDESSRPTLPQALQRLALGVATPVARVLRLDPAAFSCPVSARHSFGDHALEAEVAHAGIERLTVLECLGHVPIWPFKVELLEQRAALYIWPLHCF